MREEIIAEQETNIMLTSDSTGNSRHKLKHRIIRMQPEMMVLPNGEIAYDVTKCFFRAWENGEEARLVCQKK